MIRRAGGHDRKYTVEEKCGINRIGFILVRLRVADWSHHYLGNGSDALHVYGVLIKGALGGVKKISESLLKSSDITPYRTEFHFCFKMRINQYRR